MIKLAIYGKGGIGKSTLSSNLSSAFAKKGLTVLQIGCDPKADSTSLLLGGKRLTTVLELVRAGKPFTLEDMVTMGSMGVLCVEAGGPVPGLGCAGRGIITALEALEEKGAYEVYKPDVVIYDVLGDVVCGGFTMPMRKGYADKVYIVTSGENMSIYAAANIAMAVENFKTRDYAQLGGIILNRRNVRDEDAKADTLAADFSTEVIARIDRSELFERCEAEHKPMVELFPESKEAGQLLAAAERILN
ncbi:MAG: AAA family ATPase [Ruminococcus sp.]|nr:AAA family ATPase [Ruminococcus sp.]